MLQVNIDGFKAKLEQIETILKEELESQLLNLGNTIKEDIVSMEALSYSPTWKAAKDWKGQPYFKTHQGLLQKINESPIELTTNGNRISVGIGKISFLDQYTVSDSTDGKGFPYWRLFEYGTPGTRQGKSKGFAFFQPWTTDEDSGPVKLFGRGRRGDGYMVPVKGSLRPNKGVMPVHLFGDSLAYWKPKIGKYLRSQIRNKLQRI